MLAHARDAALLVAARPSVAALLLAGRAVAARGVVRVPRVGWVTASPVLARQALNDHRAFSMVGEGGVGHLWAQVLGPWVTELFDGPGHHDLRSRSRELFTDAAAREQVAQVWGPLLASARAALASGGEVDVADLSRVAVGRMMIASLGIPVGGSDPAGGGTGRDGDATDDDASDDDARRVFAQGERLAATAMRATTQPVLDASLVRVARDVVGDLTAGVPHAYRTAPGTTLLGRMRELGVTEREATGLSALLLVAGTETSASAMQRTVALLVDTGEQHRLLREPGRLDDAVREGLRVSTPAVVIGRSVAADVELGGRRLRTGESLLALVWSANTAVGGFRLDRPYAAENRQLWFGAGRHLCLGAPLARAEIRGLVETLWADGAPLRVVRRSAQRGVLVPGYRRLVVARA
ncbi:cytochrome P450 [Actinotalea ferrariae]|uniref:cytochrome P450 n=1 Tax=Actinotalea ferrariae TaxID=1386098 RepID=UPI001C8B4681|nr:cytochrome P450 [Actinotalea ferrariae]MBX9243775.1 cytochrome P450 [Actinotalea ferrariae]